MDLRIPAHTSLTKTSGDSPSGFSAGPAALRLRRQASRPGRWLAVLLLLLVQRAGAQTQTVLSLVPAYNALNTSPTGPLAVTFSEPVSASGAATIRVFTNQYQGHRAGTLTGVNTPVVGFRASRSFAPGETISLTIPASAVGVNNQPNLGPRVAQFLQAAPAGNGVFQQQPYFLSAGTSTISPHAEKMVLGDLDNDGDLDAVIPSYEANLAHVCLNDGLGGFGPPVPLLPPVALLGPVQVALADVDGDADLDALVVCQLVNEVKVCLNDGRGGFASTFTVPVGSAADDLHAGDLDADGDLDFVVINTLASSFSVRLNNGNGSFASASDVTVRAAPYGLAMGDVDRDGDLDLAVGHTATASIWLNNGTGGFSTPSFLGVPMGDPHEVILADLNRDSHLDLLTGELNGYVRVRMGSPGGAFGAMSTLNAGGHFGGLAAADFDADGNLDILRSAQSRVHVLRNLGGGAFAPAVTLPLSGTTATSVVTGDVDTDGDLDFLVANYLQRRVDVFLNQGAPPRVRIAGDSVLCPAASLTLRAGTTAPPVSLRWSTGATTPTIALAQPGLYTVTATFAGGLTATATHRVVPSALSLQISGDTVLCPGRAATLLGTAPGATAYQWSTGTPTAALSVSQPGTYTLTATGPGGCTVSQQVRVQSASLRIDGNAPLCPGGSATLLAVAPGATAYSWSTGATTAALLVGQPGTYEVTATFGGGCTRTATATVALPVAAIGGDTVLCANRSGQLTASLPGATAYRWSTGATTAAIAVAQPGTYAVVVTYGAGCQSQAQQRVRAVAALPSFALRPDTAACAGTAVRLAVPAGLPAGATYRWDDGARTPIRLVEQDGIYSVEVSTACETQSVRQRVMFRPCVTFPNVITPNGDRLNDYLQVTGLQGTWALRVYNRWGQPVYSTPAYRNEWGADAPAGLYYYLLQQAGSSFAQKGWVEVLR